MAEGRKRVLLIAAVIIASCRLALLDFRAQGTNRSTYLPDPDRLLEGTGKRTRHVTLRKLADVKDPRLGPLLRVAIQNGHILALSKVPVIPPQSIVKAIYARRRRPVRI